MDGKKSLINDDEVKETVGSSERLEQGPGSPTSQRSQTGQIGSVEDLVRDAITSMEKSVFQEGTPDEQREKSPILDIRVLNGIDNKPPDDRIMINTENDIGQQKTSSLKRGKKETVVLRPLTLTRKSKSDEENESLIEPGSPKIVVEREVFTQKTFDDQFEPGRRPTSTIQERTRKKMSKFSPSPSCCRSFITTLFPFIAALKSYNIRTDLTGDIVSGLTVGIMHIPQGMAYGMLTTLPPVYGLYMSFFPVLAYFFFGSSRHLSVGSFAVVCLMIGASVDKGYARTPAAGSTAAAVVDTNNTNGSFVTTTALYNFTTNVTGGGLTTQGSKSGSGAGLAEENGMSTEEIQIRLSYAMSLTFMVGFIQLLMGVTRLGFVTVYLSDPLISGFTTGAACHVFTSQIKHVFGISTKRYSGAFKLIYTYGEFFSKIYNAQAMTLMGSFVCIAMLYGVSRFINQNPKLKPKMFMPVPIELIVVILGTLVSGLAKLNEDHTVKVVGKIRTGLPMPTTPFEHIGFVITDAIAVAIVAFAISISMAKLLAKKHEYEIDSNQELVAYGISNCVSSFFASPAASASMSRSLVQERVGGKTSVAGLFSCALLLVVLLAIGPYFRTLPNFVLASIIIVALRGLFLQILDLPKLWTVSVIDFFVFVVALLATVLLDVDIGLLTAVVFGLITIVARSQRPYTCLLGRIPGTDIYTDINVYKEAQEIAGVKIFRFEYSLFFVNTEHFRSSLYKLTLNPRILKIAQRKREKRLSKRQSQGSFKADAQGGYERDVPEPSKEEEPRSNDVKITVTMATPVQNPPDCDFHTIVLDCSSWGFIDTMGVKVLISTIAEYKAIGVRVFLAKCKAGIREMFEKTRFYESVDRHNVYITVHDAVQHSIFVESPVLEKKNPFPNESEA